ncbi:bifunctional diaminohydroxyphosphoribosylaminopyrimidine deaminase/5-amino-6-(5-phosphoribosylamino)uracil reductase RibD [Devosia sp. 2618]|uniref:bifunctional diaminohydroxyphosphoribosylaminopyrimidine deaminase/5-amino-6-(5-phosphoribosylamino)uracil reductase RibD n=1 Tax=Devosia sp. 2618 TaxID=3156454 RepID=UPI00339B6A50
MSDLSSEDRRWLDAAVRFAEPYRGTTAENPTVAALVVNPFNQTLVSRAVTGKGGRPHAAAQAVELAGFDAAGSTLYVTLEPCHHWGRTPPCIDAIIRAGVMRVVIGAADPHARSVGVGVSQLESAGVEAVLAHHEGSEALHAGHFMRHTAHRPYVTVVLPTASGQGAAAALDPKTTGWRDVERSRSDAILVDAQTARDSDPKLTIQLPGLADRTPLRVVVADTKGLDRKVNLIGGFSGYRTAIIAETSVSIDAPVSIDVIRVAGTDGSPDLAKALRALSDKGVQNLLVEAGQTLVDALLKAKLVDRLVLVDVSHHAEAADHASATQQLLMGAISTAGLREIETQALGKDTLVIYERPLQSD